MKNSKLMYDIIIYSTACVLNIVGFFILLNGIIFDYIYPNACAFHFPHRPRGFLGSLFFPITGASNDHPEPGLFNILFVLTTGIISGIVMIRILKKIVWK